MSNDIRLETHFEHYISRKLEELSHNGWVISDNDSGFKADTALFFDDFVSYINTICPEKIEKMQKDMGSNWQGNLEKARH